jgi:mannose-1-phosphate guanylyltransferase
MKAVVLAGGYGKRLRPLTDEKPKPLLPVAGKPIIEWQIQWLVKHGVKQFIIATGYKKELMVEWASQSSDKFGVEILVSIEKEPMGTGGAIKRLREFLKENFLVVNGDILTNLDVSLLKGGEVATIALVPLKSPFGVVKTEDNKVVEFVEKPILEDHWINAGVYTFAPRIFDYLPEKGDLEKETFPRLAKGGLIFGVKFPKVYWRSIDSMKDLEEASQEVTKIW